jgi:hypothetical protein
MKRCTMQKDWRSEKGARSRARHRSFKMSGAFGLIQGGCVEGTYALMYLLQLERREDLA